MKHTHRINRASSVVLALSLLATGCGVDTSGDTDAGGTSAVADKSPDDRGDVVTAAGPHDSGDTACQSLPGEGPWNRDLIEWRSSDGSHFTELRVFQVCADVPSIAQDESGMLMAAFQAFEAERGKIGVRLSGDEGENWSPLTLIELVDFPTGSVRAFDPMIIYDTNSEQWRMYFSLSFDPSGRLDDTICTHSAVSDDGITYIYEAGPRFCAAGRPVIDPAVAFLDGVWYYSAPRGAPQDGAFFATSTDGLMFNDSQLILSDMNHNWTGNFVVTGGNLRFYGTEAHIPSGNFLFWAETSNKGGSWSDPTQTDVPAGKDPGIIRFADGSYMMLVPTQGD